MTRRVGAAVVVTVVVAVTAAALAGHAADRGAPRPAARVAEPPIGTPPRVLDSTRLRLPAQDYLPTAAQLAAYSSARVTLIRRCLDRFGLAGALPAGAPPTGYGPRSLTDRRYGVTDARLAARYGFGLGPRDPSRQPRPVGAAGVDVRTVLTGQGRSAVRGVAVPPGGCLGEAERALDVGQPAGADVLLPQRLQFQSFELSKRDSRVRRVFGAWSACMAAAGYDYADPLAAVADPRFTDPGPPTRAAVRTALRDIACKRATNLVGVWFAVDCAYERAAIERDPRAFRLARQAWDRRVANALAVLDGGSG